MATNHANVPKLVRDVRGIFEEGGLGGLRHCLQGDQIVRGDDQDFFDHAVVWRWEITRGIIDDDHTKGPSSGFQDGAERRKGGR